MNLITIESYLLNHDQSKFIFMILEEKCISYRLALLLDLPVIDQKIQEQYSWNPNDSSTNIVVNLVDQLTMIRRPIRNSTDCIRGKIGFSSGLHVWEIIWPFTCRGSHAIIGVATKNASLQEKNYSCVVGKDNESWGWDICQNKTYHDLISSSPNIYPYFSKYISYFNVPESILVVLDMNNGTLSYIVEGIYLGVAFDGLKNKTLFPIVNCVWGDGKITMKYYGGLCDEIISLKLITRKFIRDQIGDLGLLNFQKDINIPYYLKNYICS